MRHALIHKNLQLRSDESIELVARKHWFIHATQLAGVLTVGALPFALIVPTASFISLHPAIAGALTSLWLLVVWMALFTVWTHFFLDIWIITNKRIVDIDQVNLFTRTVATLRIERVQNVHVKTPGFFATIFGYGTIEVQTAGPDTSMYLMRGIPNPALVRNTILERVDLATEHKSSLIYNKNENPTSSE